MHNLLNSTSIATLFLDARMRVRRSGGHGNRWYSVRIMPYQTRDKRIDGVVITFFDVTLAKHLEQTLRQALIDSQRKVGSQAEALDVANRLEKVLRDSLAMLERRTGPTKIG